MEINKETFKQLKNDPQKLKQTIEKGGVTIYANKKHLKNIMDFIDTLNLNNNYAYVLQDVNQEITYNFLITDD